MLFPYKPIERYSFMASSTTSAINPSPLRSLCSVALTLAIAIFAGFALISLSYCIPTNTMVDSATRSAEKLNEEGLYPTPIPGFDLQLDNWTDSLMINQASFSYEHITDSPIIASMENYRYFNEEANGPLELDNLVAY